MESLPVIVQDSQDGAVLTVHIQPRASRTECTGLHGDALKIRVAAPPVGGAANEELVRFIAGRCGISRTQVLIRSGSEGRRKRILVRGLAGESVLARLMPVGRKGTTKS